MSTYFVSRHTGAKDWLNEEGVSVDYVVDHLDVSRIEPGDQVIGSLPINLAAAVCEKGASYFHLSIELPLNLRGCELSSDLLRDYGACIQQYHVSKAN